MKVSRNYFLIHTNFLTVISISLLYYWKNMFTDTGIWMISKNSMKFYYLKKKGLTVTWRLLEDITDQGRSEGTSSVAVEVLIINCQIYFINLFIFNCLTSNIKLFIFKLFDVKVLFSENHVFCKQKRTVYGLMDVRR